MLSLGAELAALPPAAVPRRLAALRWSDFAIDLGARLPARDWASTKLHRDRACEVGLFYLPRGHAIPLHDHPDIHVWMRVLVGRLQVTSYTWHAPPRARCSGRDLLDPSSPVWQVEPERDNLHALLALDDVAFLDVLRPPYIDGRVCTYYQPAPESDGLVRMIALSLPA